MPVESSKKQVANLRSCSENPPQQSLAEMQNTQHALTASCPRQPHMTP